MLASDGLAQSSRKSVAYCIFCPHSGQNLVPAATGFPQLGQGVMACAGGGATNMVAPQLGQNRAPCLTPFPHLGHATSAAWGCIEGCICPFITLGMRTIPDPSPAH